MNVSKNNFILVLLLGILILLMIAIVGLFIQMNRLQSEIITVFKAQIPGNGLDINTMAPDFSLTNLLGKKISLTDFKGHKVLLVFASTTCPHCIDMFPHLKIFADRSSNIQVVMVLNGSVEDDQKLVQTQGYSFPVLIWDEAIAQDYKIPGTPFFYSIDEKGVIKSLGNAITEDQIAKLVQTVDIKY